MMKYGILGATGPTGRELLKQLAGRDVSVFLRNPEKLAQNQAREVVVGQLSDTKKLSEWASRQDVVFNALGHTDRRGLMMHTLGLRPYPNPNMMQNAMKAVLGGKPKKIVDCSAYGTGKTRGDLPFYFGKLIVPTLLAVPYADHEAVEELLEHSSVDWTIALPGMLTNGPKTEVYRAQERFSPGKTIWISRADVAHFMIRASQDPSFSRKKIGLGY